MNHVNLTESVTACSLDYLPILDSYNSHQPHNREDKSHFDLADQLEDLHATIMERLDKLDDMRAQLRNEYVPSNVCQNLEQCLKDTEVSWQIIF